VATSYHVCLLMFVPRQMWQQSQNNTAVRSARTYPGNIYSYVEGISHGTTQHTTWFGTYDSGRKTTVGNHFKLIGGNNFPALPTTALALGLEPTPTSARTTFDRPIVSFRSLVMSLTDPSKFGSIYFCGAFWNTPLDSTDSKTGTIAHEASHLMANGGTKDRAYCQSSCKSLVASDPAKAVFNADSTSTSLGTPSPTSSVIPSTARE